jgi:hypothetical protein
MTPLETAATLAEAQIEKSASKVTEKQRKKVEASIGVAFTAAVRSRNIDNLRGVFGRLKDEAYGAVGGKKKVLEALAGRVKEVKDEVQTSEFEGSELQDVLEHLGIEMDVQRDVCTDCQFYEFTGEMAVRKASLESDCARADFNAMTIVSVPHPKTGAMSCFKSDELSAYVLKFDGPVPYPRGFASGDMPPDIVDHIAQWQTALEDLKTAIKDGTLSHDEVQFFYRFADKLAPTSAIDAKSTYAAWAWRRLERAAPFLKGVKKGAKMAYSWLHILNGNRHWLMFVRAVICGVIIAKFVSGLAVSGALTGTAKAAIILKWVAVHSIGSMLTALFAQLRTIAGGTLTIIISLLFRGSAYSTILSGLKAWWSNDQSKYEAEIKKADATATAVGILSYATSFFSSKASKLADGAQVTLETAADLARLKTLQEKIWAALKRAPVFKNPLKAVPDIGSISAWVLYMRPSILCRILSGLFSLSTAVAAVAVPSAGIKLLQKGTSRVVEGCDKLTEVWSYIMPMATLVPMVTEILSDLLFAFNVTGHTAFLGPTSCQRLVSVGVPPAGVEYSGDDIADDVLFKALQRGEKLTAKHFKDKDDGVNELLNFIKRSQNLKNRDKVKEGDQEGAHFEENRTLGQQVKYSNTVIENKALALYLKLKAKELSDEGHKKVPLETVLDNLKKRRTDIKIPEHAIIFTFSDSEKEKLLEKIGKSEDDAHWLEMDTHNKDEALWNRLNESSPTMRTLFIDLTRAKTAGERNDAFDKAANSVLKQHLKNNPKVGDALRVKTNHFSEQTKGTSLAHKVHKKVNEKLFTRARLISEEAAESNRNNAFALAKQIRQYRPITEKQKSAFSSAIKAQNEFAKAIKSSNVTEKELKVLRQNLEDATITLGSNQINSVKSFNQWLKSARINAHDLGIVRFAPDPFRWYVQDLKTALKFKDGLKRPANLQKLAESLHPHVYFSGQYKSEWDEMPKNLQRRLLKYFKTIFY